MDLVEVPTRAESNLYLRASLVNFIGNLMCFISNRDLNSPIRRYTNAILIKGLNNYIGIKDSSEATANALDNFSFEVAEYIHQGSDFLKAVRLASADFEFKDPIQRIYGQSVIESVGILLSAKAMEYANKPSLNLKERFKATMLYLVFGAYYKIALIEVNGE